MIQLTDGRMLVSWTTASDQGPGSPDGTDVLGQYFGGDGRPLSGQFLLNSFHTGSNEEKLVMAAMPDGGFVTAYEDIAGNATSIRLEYFGADGTRLAQNDFITDTVSGLPASEEPRIAVSASGSIAVVYEYQTPDYAKQVVLRIWNPVTDFISYPATLSTSIGPDRDASIAALNNGKFVVTWHNPSAGNGGIEARIVEPNGAVVLPNFVVKDTYATSSLDHDPDVAALAGGGFVIVWQNNALDTDIFYEVFDADGTSLTSATANIVNNTADDAFRRPQVVAHEDGGFVIMYRNASDGDELRAQRYDSAGSEVGSSIRVTSFDNPAHEAVLLGDGRIATAVQNLTNGDMSLIMLDTRDTVGPGGPGLVQYGTVSDDIISVDLGTTAVYAHWGSDEVLGAVSDDILYGGFSNDRLSGNGGNDRIFGDGDEDILFGGAGNDYLDGGTQDDSMSGGLGNDFYIVDRLGDVVFGEIAFSAGGGIDTVRSFVSYVQPENIELVRLGNLFDTAPLTAVGNDAPGTLVGNAGDNSLTGRGGDDQINGNGGDDRMIGNTGRDTLVGGAGADTFVYTSISESRAGAANRDVINGFDRGADIIDLSTMDANLGLAGDAAFTFIGTASFSGDGGASAGQLRLQGLGGPNAVIVEGDLRGDGVADFQIFVNLTTVLSAEDFIL